MTCRQKINQAALDRLARRYVSDTHLDIAETLEGNLRVWLAAIHPEASTKVLSMYAEEIVDQAFDALHDLAMDIDASTEKDY